MAFSEVAKCPELCVTYQCIKAGIDDFSLYCRDWKHYLPPDTYRSSHRVQLAMPIKEEVSKLLSIAEQRSVNC